MKFLKKKPYVIPELKQTYLVGDRVIVRGSLHRGPGTIYSIHHRVGGYVSDIYFVQWIDPIGNRIQMCVTEDNLY